MIPFRILDLPELLFRTVIKYGLNVGHLALCSSKSHRAIVSLRLKNVKVEVRKTDCCQAVSVYSSQWTVLHRKDAVETEIGELANPLEKVTIEGHNFWLGREDRVINSFWCVIENEESKEESVEVWKRYARSLFVSLHFDYMLNEKGTLDFYDYYKRHICKEECKSVYIYGTDGKYKNEWSFIKEFDPISWDTLRFVLDNTRSNMNLFLCSEVKSNFKYEKVFHVRYLDMSYFTKWFSRQVFFNAQCKKIRIKNRGFLSVGDLNEFLRRWSNGEYPDIRHMYISMRLGEPRWDEKNETKSILYANLEVKELEPVETMTLLCPEGAKFLTVAKIERDDGLSAFIGFSQHCFVFCVGHKFEEYTSFRD